MIFNMNSTRGQTRFLTCVARVTCLVRNKRSTKLGAVHVLLKPAHNSAQLRCFENGNDDFGLEAFCVGDAARVGYFVPLNGPLNGHSPSNYNSYEVMQFKRADSIHITYTHVLILVWPTSCTPTVGGLIVCVCVSAWVGG